MLSYSKADAPLENQDASLPGPPLLWQTTLGLLHCRQQQGGRRECLTCRDSGLVEEFEFCPHCEQRPLVADRYQIIRRLGKGNWATVFLAADRWREAGLVALKIYPRGNAIMARAERDHLLLLRAASTVSCLQAAFCTPAPKHWSVLVLEYLQPLERQLFSQRLEMTRRLAYDLTMALREAHSRNLLHGDLKGENVLWHPHRLRFILADWSNAIPLAQLLAYYGSFELGSWWYRAPETLLHRPSLDPGVDVWALGILLLEQYRQARVFTAMDRDSLLTEQVALLGPFPPTLQPDDLNNVNNGWFLGEGEADGWLLLQLRRQSLARHCPPELAAFLAYLLDPDPQTRPSSHNLLAHPFLRPCL